MPPSGRGGVSRASAPVPDWSSAPLARDLPSRADIPATTPPAATPVTAVAFYLPQFHTIAENDQWWGEGFTEWTNVRRGVPVFPGHHQPHVPGDLGYYDLVEDPDVMRRQARMARLHGVDAWCFYVYWFAGTRLLERPVERFLADTDLDMQFCVCWANENWTRTWDGDHATGLMVQQHSADDDLAFIEAMAPALRDPRALRVAGRPLLLVYRPGLLPDPGATAERWRVRCRELGIGEIALAYVRGFELPRPEEIGFDFSVEFPPPHSDIDVVPAPAGTRPDFTGPVYDLGAVARREVLLPAAANQWRGVCPSWDNTARRPENGAIMRGAAPEDVRDWFVRAGRDTVTRFADPSARLVWINAWNEWAEGAHLEPDRAFGYQWLHAVRDGQEALAGVVEGTGPGVVLVVHDLHRHGAQMLSLAMYAWLRRWGVRATAVALGDGVMRADFEAVGPLHVVDDTDAGACRALAEALAGQGFAAALANSSVTGRFAAHLAAAGVDVTGLVHELPEVLAELDRGPRAEALAACAEVLVFPAELVRDRFPYPVPATTTTVVAPQGIPGAIPTPGDAAARASLRARLGLPGDALVVVGAGYGDWRKGVDLFTEMLGRMVAGEGAREVHAIWLGRLAEEDPRIAGAVGSAPPGRLHLPGFVEDVAAHLRGADVFALTSREDPFPTVALEAMAAGLPVVALEGATGLRALLSDGGGSSVPAGDPAAFATACAAAARAGSAIDGQSDAERRHALVADRHNFHRWMLDLLARTPAAIPRVSVVIPNYNYGHLLTGRVGQVLSQGIAPYELILLDDASTDDSVSVAQAAVAGVEVPCQIVVNDANTGSPCAQWEQGARLARGEVVWIAEADDVAHPSFLAEVLSGFDEPGHIVLSYCQSRQVDEAGRVLAPDYRDYTADVDQDYTRRYVADGAAEIQACLSVKNTIPNVSAVLFDRAALVGALDACGPAVRALRYAGDWRLYLEVLTRGRVAFTPRALNDHRRHAASVIGAGTPRPTSRRSRRCSRSRAGSPGFSPTGPPNSAGWPRRGVSLGLFSITS